MNQTTFFLLLAGLFALGVGLALRARFRYARSVRTRAKIVGRTRSMGHSAEDSSAGTRAEFFLVEFKDHRGKTQRVQLNEALSYHGGTSPHVVDGQVAIFYDPRDPRTARLDAFWIRYMVAYACMVPGVLVALVLAGVKFLMVIGYY